MGLNDELATTSTLYETSSKIIIIKIYGWFNCHAGLVLVYLQQQRTCNTL